MIIPTLKEARILAEGHHKLPIAMELFADVNTSVGVLGNLRNAGSNCFLLESVTTNETWGRYSFLGYQPSLVLSSMYGKVTVSKGTNIEELHCGAISAIHSLLDQYKSPKVSGLPPFTGGLVGYFSYEFTRYFEPSLQLDAENPEKFDDLRLMLVDKVIAFDHFRQKIILIVNIDTADLETAYIKGVSELKDMECLVKQQAFNNVDMCECGVFTPRFTMDEYCEVVEKVKRYIREGDIFQAVPSNRFTANFKGNLFQAYRRLRTVNPSPYMVYMDMGDVEIACASPETLVSLKDGVLHTYPLAGTCPRGASPKEDMDLVAALLADEKELAEHDMLVDLGRNDLGKVSRFGSVSVDEYRMIKQFSHVSHIASHVSGHLASGNNMLDALGAVLPAGTLSGAPKKRAMEIIDSLEKTRRGIYGGAIGYLDFTGNMDLCIGIRMAVRKGDKVYVQAGGGVVADSVPEKEYEETCRKARAIMEVLSAGKEEL